MIEDIRAKIAAGLFEFSKHAVDQSLERRITVAEIKKAIADGEIIEDYPNDKYGPSCLILGLTEQVRALHIQCTYPFRDMIKIITNYEPDPDLWVDFRTRSRRMKVEMKRETMKETKVTYTLEMDGKFIIIKNVPARVCEETGEEFFSPETVERLQTTIWNREKPSKTIETPVYEFAT